MTDAPPVALAHQLQRLALDRAWRLYGHDTEARERAVTWFREHGEAVWQVLKIEADTLRTQRDAAVDLVNLAAENVRSFEAAQEVETALRDQMRADLDQIKATVVDQETRFRGLLAEQQRLKAEATRNILRYTTRGYAAGESTDGRHWRERAEAAEKEVARQAAEITQLKHLLGGRA